jgi:hypothetical protein
MTTRGPERYLSFIDLAPFAAAWNDLGLGDEDHAHLEELILAAPTRHPVILGTDGVRKMRYAPAKWNVGKSGAIRVCYVCFAALGTIVLLTAYPKNVKDSLSAKDRRLLNQAVDRTRKALENFRRKRRAQP